MNGRIRKLLAAAAVSTSMGSWVVAQEPGVVMIDSGPLSGVEKGAVFEYLGIPYAAAPVGGKRWMLPEPAKSWTQTRAATEFGSTCPQNADLGVFAKAGGAEDCLYLNVYTGKTPDSSQSKRPVLVWLHGGAYSVGTGSDHDGSKLATGGNAVVVTINYRLGVLGFLAHKTLDGEGHSFGNYGLMDQQYALQWVKRNIAAFGGDPANVTIFGESSGGTSVMSHVVSPGSAGLFQHAISMSGSAIVIKHPNFGAPRPLDFAQELGAKFADAVGCHDQSAACLRAVPVATILAAQGPYVVNQAIIDGTTLPTTYAEAFKNGTFNRVTLINGNTSDEWRWAVGFGENASGKALNDAGYTAAIEGYYGKDLAPKVLAEYAPDRFGSPSEAFGAAVTDSLFACTGRKLNSWVAGKTPTYAYEFADQTAPSYLAPTTFPLGAAHTFELAYIFPGYHGGAGNQTALNPLQEKLSDAMVSYWAGAGKMAETEAAWPKYDPAKDNYMTLALPEPKMTLGRFAKDHKCDFWDQSGLY